MRHLFILNPCAGKKDNSGAWREKIESACQSRGADYLIHVTTGAGDACETVRSTLAASDEPVRIYACGGDGTLNEIVNGVIGFSQAQISVIPDGTGNDFVRNFSRPEQFLDIETQLDGEPIKLDAIRVNDRYCINMINIGFDCEVVRKTDSIKKSPLVPNGLAYLVGVLATLIRKPGVKAKISFDGSEPEDCRFLLTAIGNGAFCGGGYDSLPPASLRDGKMDFLGVSNLGRIKFLSLLGDYKKGKHLDGRAARYMRHVAANEITMDFGSEQAVCVDGEIVYENSVRLSVVPEAVSFSVPAGSELVQGEKK